MIKPPSEQVLARIKAFMRDFDRDAAYLGAFPTGYDVSLALDSTYVDQLEILEVLCAANAEIGSDSVLYIPIETSPGWTLEQVAANEDARELWEFARDAPECYLSNPDFEWFAFS
jgi:hypothetical protein